MPLQIIQGVLSKILQWGCTPNEFLRSFYGHAHGTERM